MNNKFPFTNFHLPFSFHLKNLKIEKLKNRLKMESDKWQIQGYTFVELLVSMGILIVLFALITVNISPLPSNTLQNTNLDTLISDIRAQQTLSMSNDAGYGVHFENNSYTLFNGLNYTQGSASNFVVNLDSGIVFSNVTFPGSAIVFLPGSGDVSGYTAGQDSFTLGSSVTGKNTIVKINKYGATY